MGCRTERRAGGCAVGGAVSQRGQVSAEKWERGDSPIAARAPPRAAQSRASEEHPPAEEAMSKRGREDNSTVDGVPPTSKVEVMQAERAVARANHESDVLRAINKLRGANPIAGVLRGRGRSSQSVRVQDRCRTKSITSRMQAGRNCNSVMADACRCLVGSRRASGGTPLRLLRGTTVLRRPCHSRRLPL